MTAPRWIVCEDGTEYLDRFTRFLESEFRFVRAADAAELFALLDGAAGVILDLDFRRTPPERLIDEQGRPGGALTGPERGRLAASQGLLILRALRSRPSAIPVLLFADVDDAEQVTHLERTLAPLTIVPSHEGLLQTASRMRAIG